MADTINDGGPAFPVQELNADGSPYALMTGMTLRDYFAAKAMQGDWADSPPNPDYFSAAASRYYAMADAMLKARAE